MSAAVSAPQGDVTRLLDRIQSGDASAHADLFRLIYDELKRTARRLMKRERPDHTLQATALVNEAYLKLTAMREQSWKNREHFLAIAAKVMRQILVDHARAKAADRRGGRGKKVDLEHVFASPGTTEYLDTILAVHEALVTLSELDPRQSQIVELAHFGGLSQDEIAQILNVNVRTVKRDWSVAKAWLHKELA